MFPQDARFYSAQKLWTKGGKAECDYSHSHGTGSEGVKAAALKEDKACYHLARLRHQIVLTCRLLIKTQRLLLLMKA